MIEWRLTVEDVGRIRFAFSPLAELVLSLVVLRAPSSHALHLPWVREVRPRLAGLDLTELFGLVPVRGLTADFLTPSPTSPLPDLAEELERVRATPPERMLADLADLIELGDPPGLAEFIARPIRQDPEAAANRIADSLAAYWELALREHWARILALLEADVLWRGRRLAAGGAKALFTDLHDTITWHGDRVRAADPYDYAGDLSGEGIVLVPSVMCWPNVRKNIAPYQPMLIYPARGVATLWETGGPAAPAALAALIGRTRATTLLALAEPISTTALAHRLQLTPGAISQHLSVLLDCGLVTRSRIGRSVLYRRTRSGDALTGADQPGAHR